MRRVLLVLLVMLHGAAFGFGIAGSTKQLTPDCAAAYGTWYSGNNYGSNNLAVVTPYHCSEANTAGQVTCSADVNFGGGIVHFACGATENVVCNPGASKVGTDCVCMQGLHAVGQNCSVDDCGAVAAGLDGMSLSWDGTGTSGCYMGCKISSGAIGRKNGKSHTASDLPHFSTGSCAGDKVTGNGSGVQAFPGGEGGAPAPGACPAGSCPGQVNGQDVCAKCDGVAAAPSEQGASGVPLDGNAPVGADHKESTKECTGDRCTTTEKYYDKDGNLLAESSDTEDKLTFCQENPALAICKDTNFGGACGAGFQCNGDAVQCAIAQEQHKRNCEFFAQNSASDAGLNAANGEDRPGGHPGNNPSIVDMSGQISTADVLGGGGCVADFVFGYSGQSLSIPFSRLCPYLDMMGMIAQGFAMLSAVFIVFRS